MKFEEKYVSKDVYSNNKSFRSLFYVSLASLGPWHSPHVSP
jgi:hypothetical protein